MSPAHTHIHFDVLFRAGALSIIIVGDPGTQGAGVFGMQGIGVRTPIAAAVAADTDGLAMLRHNPNGIMLIIGAWSVIFAAGCWLLITGLFGSTIRADGDDP